MKLRIIATTLMVASTAACATIVQGSNQGVAVNSTPAGAAITVDGQSMGTTPAVLRLARNNAHTVRLEMPGYAPYELKLERKMSGWVWGNLAFGGIVGVIVDGSTGAMYRLSPGEVNAGMQTRTAMVDGQPAIEIAVVMTADPSWEKIGQLSPE